MFLFILGIVDLVAGTMLGMSGIIGLDGNSLVLFLGLLMIVKGIVSYLAGAAKGFYMDFMGILDLVSGIMLILAFYGFVLFFFPYIGLLLLLKGVYSMIMGLVRK